LRFGGTSGDGPGKATVEPEGLGKVTTPT
jgi:hypothetical protein